MTREKRKLVTRFEQLAKAPIVVFVDCDNCGAGDHVLFLGALGEDYAGRPAYKIAAGGCGNAGMVGDVTIGTRRLFIIEDGIDTTADARQAAQDERDAAFRAKARREAERLERSGARR